MMEVIPERGRGSGGATYLRGDAHPLIHNPDAAKQADEGITTKAWTTQDGQVREGKRIDKKYLYKLLRTIPSAISLPDSEMEGVIRIGLLADLPQPAIRISSTAKR